MRIPGNDTRVVELRVHGVSGTSAASLVDAVDAVDVAGDGVGRVVRPADRLRRPAPAGVLLAGSRPVPRTVEGYLWGAMTSGGWAKATWALLFPFALANVAHWMLPPLSTDSAPARTLGLLLRALLRLAALLLTALLVTQLALLTVDMIAAQCLAPANTACLTGPVPGAARELSWLRPVLGLLPVVLVAWVLHGVSSTEWTAPEPGGTRHGDGPSDQPLVLPAAPLVGDPDVPTLRVLHTVAALAVSVLLVTGGPNGPADPAASGGAGPPWLAVLWWTSVGLLAVAVAGVVLLDDPTGSVADRAGDWVRAVLGPWVRRLLVMLGLGLVAAAAGLVTLPDTAGTLPGSDATVQLVGAMLSACCGAVGLLLVPAARMARSGWAELPPKLRPWAGGWAAAPVLAMAALLGGGFGAGVALTVRRLLGGSSGLQLPDSYWAVTLVWGAGGLVVVAGAAVTAAVLGVRRWQLYRGRTAAPPEVELLHRVDEPAQADRPGQPGQADRAAAAARTGRVAERERAASAWWQADLLRCHVHHALLGITGVLVVITALTWVTQLPRVGTPAWSEPISAIGVTALAALAGGLLTAVYRAARRPEARRALGVVWDLASFWPREAHPTVPPCYPLKVVPDLVRRAREHLADPSARVVLAGQSHGGLLAAVAAARLLAVLPPADRERVGLVTAGAQLQWAYQRGFPAVLPHTSLGALAGGLGGRWRALCRGTDPLGGATNTWRRQAFEGRLLGVGFREDGSEGALPPATVSPTGALILGTDHWLPDPRRAPVPGRRWRAGILGHRDYLADPEWDVAVAMAAGLPVGNGNGRHAPGRTND